jgi:biopolymer transport protein ExbB
MGKNPIPQLVAKAKFSASEPICPPLEFEAAGGIMQANSPLVDQLMAITLFGSEWVLWLLIGMSVLSIAVIIERGMYLWRNRAGDFSDFLERLSRHLNAGEIEQAKQLATGNPSIEYRVALTAIDAASRGAESVQRLVSSCLIRERQLMDRGLVILGTLGNNTPFIGLFGTVLGIIQAFHALSLNPAGGSAVVMAGISEALIATAVGLLVAIPAVIAFNAFQRIVKGRVANAEAVQELVLSYMVAVDDQESRGAA